MDKLIILVFFVIANVAGQFDLQFIGDSITSDSEQKRDYCNSKYCLLDANNLFYAATQNSSITACDDFKEFSLGTFIKYRAVDDRERYNGLWGDVQNAHNEQKRKFLAEKINSKDSRVVKVMKKFFDHCVNATFVKGDGTKAVREYFESLGIAVYPSTDRSNFNLSKMFEREPHESTSLFLKHELQRCQHPKDSSKEILCLKLRGGWEHPELIFNSYPDVLYEMNNVFKNASFAKNYREDFNNISRRMFDFYRQQVRFCVNKRINFSR